MLQLISSGGFFGAESVLVELARGLLATGQDVVVGAFNNRHRSNLEVITVARSAGLPTVVFDCRGPADPGTIGRIRRFVRERGIQFIHSHGYKSNIYARLSTIGTKVHLVATCHNWIDASAKMKLYAISDRLILRGFDSVVAVSSTVHAALLATGLDPHRLALIENGVPVERFAPQGQREAVRRELGFEPAHCVIGTVGRLSPEKNQAALLRALARLRPEYSHCRLLLVGDGPSRVQLEAIARELGIESAVLFAGRRTDVARMLAAMDLFVLPSLTEAQPISLLEAMAAGIPVLASRVGDVAKILRQGELGALVAAGDDAELTGAISTVVEAREAALARAALASQAVLDSHSAAAMVRRYLELYDRMACASAQNREPGADAGRS